MKRKIKQKPPKFYVSVAMKDLARTNEFLSAETTFKVVIEALKKLYVTLSNGQLAPLPKDLNGSLYDPKMLELRSDDDFVNIYRQDFENTAEECIAVIMYHILLYDISYNAKYHIQRPDSDNKFEFGTCSIRYDMLRHAKTLIEECECNEYLFNVPKMLTMLYPCMIQFAEKLYLDLNSFIRWYIRYSEYYIRYRSIGL